MARQLIDSLQDARLYPHPVKDFQVIETHISWVLLTGCYAYKIRKPVNFGFLDFTHLDQRLKDCQEELRLNRRQAAPLYLGLVTLTGSESLPALDGNGDILDYAVKMVQFPQSDLLSARLRNGLLATEHLEHFAEQLAAFHRQLPGADAASDYGSPNTIEEIVLQNFEQIRPRLNDNQDLKQLDRLESWTREEFNRRKSLLRTRQRQGWIRECHGDLHLGNMVWFGDQALAFDCIEFNPRYRWIDPLNDIAFLLMDLHYHRRPDLANRILSRYLEAIGDDHGLPLLRFYLVYRALVRAKITLLSCPDSADSASQRQYRRYAELAAAFSQPSPKGMLLMRGVSGSGKSWLSRKLVDQSPWIQIRSDAERMRLHAAPDNQTLDRYGPELNELTYRRLYQRAADCLAAGYSPLIDATFLDSERMDRFAALARQHQCRIRCLDCQAPLELLNQRLKERQAAGQDPSEADRQVLQRQLEHYRPLSANSPIPVYSVDTSDQQAVRSQLNQLQAWQSPSKSEQQFE